MTLLDVQTERWDGVNMSFLGDPDALTLGNVVSGVPRIAFWNFRADTPGPKTFKIRAWSENGGEVTLAQTVEVPPLPDLVETAVTANPPAPVRAPGTTFAVADTVKNTWAGAVRAHDDALLAWSPGVHRPGTGFFPLTGSRAVPAVDGRGEPVRDRHGDHPCGHPAQYVLPLGMCRWPECRG